MLDRPLYVDVYRCSAWAAALAAACVVAPRRARADAPRVQWVRGDGAESCPDADALLAEVVRRSGGAGLAASASSPSVEAVVTREDGVWLARVFVRDARGDEVGRREVRSDAPTCSAIASAVALAALLAIEPEGPAALDAAAPPAPVLAPPPPPIPARPARPAARAVRPAPVRVASDVRVVALAAGSAGALPAVAGGGGLAFDARVLGALRVAAGLAVFGDVEAARPARAFAFGLTQAWLLACVEAAPLRALALDACAGASAGLVHASAAAPYVLQPGGGADRPWGGPAIGARVSLRLAGPLEAQLGLDVAANVVRYAFTVDTGGVAGVVFAQSPVVGSGYAGLGLHFR